MSKYKQLQEIVKGPPKESATPTELVAQSQIDRSESFIRTLPSGISGKEKYVEWEKEVARNWVHLPENKDYFWNTREKLYPASEKTFRDEFLQRTSNEVRALSSNYQKYNYFQQKSSGWPKWLQETYSEEMSKSKYILESQSTEYARINYADERDSTLNSLLSDKEFRMSPMVSKKSHDEDIYNSLLWGFTSKEIRTNEEGRVSVPLDGTLTPVYSIDPSLFPVHEKEQVMLLIDSKNAIDRATQASYNHLVEEMSTMQKANARELYLRINNLNKEQRNEFGNNIILDHSINEVDQVRSVSNGIVSLLKKDISDGKFDSRENDSHLRVTKAYLEKWASVIETQGRRI